jgi:ABC-type phosphate transport system substrate-binding protein
MATLKHYFEFDIVKWDETGNILLEKHTMVVQRQSLSSARTVVRKKYSVRKGYFEELKNKWVK